MNGKLQVLVILYTHCLNIYVLNFGPWIFVRRVELMGMLERIGYD